jgi:hypothetical protein
MRPFIAIFIFTWFLNLFLPWWPALFPAIIFGAWLLKNGLSAFSIGLAAGGFAWFVQAFYIHIANDAILSTRVAEMLQLGSPWLVLLFTFLIGGILAGFGTLFGYQLKAVLTNSSIPDTN